MSNLICPYLKDSCCEGECVMWDEGCIIRESIIRESLLGDDLDLDDDLDDNRYLSEEQQAKIGIFRDMSEDALIKGLEDYIQEFRVRSNARIWVPNKASRYWEHLGVRYVGILDIEEKKARVEQVVQSIFDSELV